MNRYINQYIAIPAIFVAIIVIVLSKFNDSEEVTPVVKHVSSTKPRVRGGDSSVSAMSSNRIRRENPSISEGITSNQANISEEF
ncbi:MAG: hypothetical protein ACK57I_08050, partial [Akkermansiaceae bacterium]